MKEDNIIDLAKKLNIYSPYIIKGIDDDTAVYKINKTKYELFTTDMLVEGTHFKKNTISPFDLGWKSLAVNLSDIAAMGGEPIGTLLSLGLPKDIEDKWIKEFFKGLKKCAKSYNTPLIGGDTVKSDFGIVINIALIGITKKPIYRTGINNNDLIILTGKTGLAGAGFYLSENIEIKNLKEYKKFLNAFYKPKPHLEISKNIVKTIDKLSMIDSSDGLVRSLEIMCEQNNIGAIINKKYLPVDKGLIMLAQRFNLDYWDWVLYGGEDYILVCAISEQNYTKLKNKLRNKLYKVGYFSNKVKGVFLEENNKLINLHSKYFKHFE